MAKTEELTGRHSIDLDKAPEIPQAHLALLASVPAMKVTDDQSCAEATRMIEQSGAAIKRVEDYFDSDREMAHKLHVSITSKIKTITAPFREVRTLLAPRIKAYLEEKERQRREAERRAQEEADRQRREAEAEARRIQAEADARAAELRKQGEMRQAREAEAAATQQAQSVVQQADELAAIGTILPDAKPVGGPGESRPWVAEVVDIKLLCRAIADGTVELEQMMSGGPKTGQMVPLITVDQAAINNIAKRMGREDIGLPGVKGTRGLQLRFSSKEAPVPYAKRATTEDAGW